MADSYGTKIGNALRAIERLHSDASKLLQDCDKTIGKGKESLFTKVTDIKCGSGSTLWMAEGVFRWYASEEEPEIAESILVAFFDADDPELEEPYLVVGRAKYRVTEEKTVEDLCCQWDLWDAFFYCDADEDDGCVNSPAVDDPTIEWLKYVAVPLYDIKNIEDVVGLMQKLRQAC